MEDKVLAALERPQGMLGPAFRERGSAMVDGFPLTSLYFSTPSSFPISSVHSPLSSLFPVLLSHGRGWAGGRGGSGGRWEVAEWRCWWVGGGEYDSGGGWVAVVVTAAMLILLLGIPLIPWVHKDQLDRDGGKPDQPIKAVGIYRSP